jgi:hypothetical protein
MSPGHSRIVCRAPGAGRSVFQDLKAPRGDHVQTVIVVFLSYRRFAPSVTPRLGVAQYDPDFVVPQITQEPAITFGTTRVLEKDRGIHLSSLKT